MVAHGTEAQLIGDVVHADLLAVLVDVRVVALLHHRLVLLARVLQEALGALLDPVGRLVLVLEVAVLVHLLFRLEDRDVLDVVVMVVIVDPSGHSTGDQYCADCDELEEGDRVIEEKGNN